MTAVKNLCKRGVVLDQGLIAFDGDVEEAIELYIQNSTVPIKAADLASIKRPSYCSSKIKFNKIEFLNEKDEVITPVSGKYLKIKVTFFIPSARTSGCSLSMDILTSQNHPIINLPTIMKLDEFNLSHGEHSAFCIIKKLPLTEGTYNLSLWAKSENQCADHIDSQLLFKVEDNDFYGKGRSTGPHLKGKIVLCDYDWIV